MRFQLLTAAGHPQDQRAGASGENIVGAEERGTDLRAPIGSKGPSEESASIGDFDFDKTRTTVLSCPMGHVPVSHEKPGKS